MLKKMQFYKYLQYNEITKFQKFGILNANERSAIKAA